MQPNQLLTQAIIPAFAGLEKYGIKDTFEARRMVLAIALQESAGRYRRQVNNAGEPICPASSYWQFEKGGGCAGVLNHAAVCKAMRQTLKDNDIGATIGELWEAMRYHDIVAATAARLLLYTLPNKLPDTMQDGWNQYLKAWRPGKPHVETWASNWAAADSVCRAVDGGKNGL